jgi:hypothetical protein
MKGQLKRQESAKAAGLFPMTFERRFLFIIIIIFLLFTFLYEQNTDIFFADETQSRIEFRESRGDRAGDRARSRHHHA